MGELQQIRQTEEPWVNANEVSKHLPFTPNHIRIMAKRGQIPGRNVGYGKKSCWVFRISEINKRLQESA